MQPGWPGSRNWYAIRLSSRGASGKESACQCKRCRFNPQLGKIPWSRKWQPTPVFLPRASHGHRTLVGYRLWGHKESDVTGHTHIYTHTGSLHFSPVLLPGHLIFSDYRTGFLVHSRVVAADSCWKSFVCFFCCCCCSREHQRLKLELLS